MKRLLALFLLTAGILTAADNYRVNDTRTTGTTNAVVLRSTDTAGIHTPHVIVDSGSAVALSRSSTIATTQSTLSTSASQILASNSARHSALVRNTDASISVYVGVTGVTSTTGFLVKAGESVTVNSTAAIFAVSASGSPVVHTLVEND